MQPIEQKKYVEISGKIAFAIQKNCDQNFSRFKPEDIQKYTELIFTIAIDNPEREIDLRPNSPPLIWRIRRFVFGLMQPVFAMPFSWRIRWV